MDHALRTDAAIVTKDEDFAQRRAMVDGRPRNIWIRLPNARRRDCLRFEKAFPAILHALDGGEPLIEIV
jgi:predicted nuclease of predicted toxin-antitoxin system